MYLLIGTEIGQFTKEKITEEFRYTSTYLIEGEFIFNMIFGNFIREYF